MANGQGLTAKQKAFCHEYIAQRGNARQAAINAGYSVKTAHVQAHENLNKPNIQEYLRELTEARMGDLMSRGDQVIEQLMSFAFRERQTAYSKRTDLVNDIVESEHMYEFDPSIEEANKSLDILARIMGLGRSENADLKRRLMEAQVRRVELENEALEAKIRPKEGQEEQVGHFIDSLGDYYDDEEEESRPQDVHQETKPGDEESQE